MALTERSGSGFIVGGVTDTTPDWLGSYTEGYDAAQQQKTTAINQQEAKQRMGLAVAEEQRLAAKFANEQADREAVLKSYAGVTAPEVTPFTPQQGAGLMPDVYGPVQPPYTLGAAGAGPTVSPAAAANLEQYMPEFTQVESELGLPAGYLKNISILESSGGLNVGDSKGKYVGMFQIGPEVAKDFGITPEQARDPRVAGRVAALLAQRNAQSLRKALGREPQPWELYLAHQQGAGGAAALLKNPNGRAIDVMTSVYGGDAAVAYRVIVGNGGSPDMTAGQFAQLWGQKYSGQPVSVEAPATAAAAATEPGVSIPTSGEVDPIFVAQNAPDSTRYGKQQREIIAQSNRRQAWRGIVGGLREAVPYANDLFEQFMPAEAADASTAQRKVNADALTWYDRPEIGKFFDANPAALTEARKDPVAFYKKYKDQFPAAQPTPGAQTQTAPPAQPSPGVQTQQSLQYAPALTPPNTIAAGVVEQGQGTIADQIARTPPGRVVTLPDSGIYLVEPMMIDNEMRQLEAQRQNLLAQFEQAKALRDLTSLNDARDKLVQNSEAANKMQAMKVLSEMQQGDDDTFASALSGMTQNRARIQRRPDGTFNYYYDGQLRAEGIDRNQIIAGLRMQYDDAFQANVTARAKAAGERDQKILESELKIREQITLEEAKMLANVAAKRDELAIKNANPEYNITVGDDGTVTAVPKTGNPVPIRYVPEVILGVDDEPVLDADGNPKYKLVPAPVQGQ